MRKPLAYPLAALVTAGAVLSTAPPANAHGYVSSPPSRQALCAAGTVGDCGPIRWEPQSVEGPKGLRSCDGGLDQFSVLSDESRNWPATDVGTTVTFSWVLTARHRTSNWEYFIGDTKIADIDAGNAVPGSTVTHEVDLSGFPGRQTVLAVWNIGDTPNAFYNCIDLTVGGGGSGAPAPEPEPAPEPAPEPEPAPTTREPEPSPQPEPAPEPEPEPAPAPTAVMPTAPTATPTAPNGVPGPDSTGQWAPGTTYQVGDEVSYGGQRFSCRQAHTSLHTWEPSIYTAALWLPL